CWAGYRARWPPHRRPRAPCRTPALARSSAGVVSLSRVVLSRVAAWLRQAAQLLAVSLWVAARLLGEASLRAAASASESAFAPRRPSLPPPGPRLPAATAARASSSRSLSSGHAWPRRLS